VTNNSSQANSLDLFALVAMLWREKLMVVATVAVCAIAGVAYALLATPVYKAEIVMTPAGQRTPSASLGQLSGLAALAGVNLGSEGTTTPLAVLKSRAFAEEFIRENKLEAILVDDFGDPSEDLDIRDALHVFLKDVRVVSEDKKAGTVTLSIYWEDPVVAAEWANSYIERLNARLRARALADSERNVKFLQQEIANTTIVSVQQSVGRILEAEMQQYMLAKGDVEYAYKVVDRASPPKLRESPKRVLVVLLSVLIGAVLAVLVVIARSGLLKRSRVAS
jgi:uncharacterized protein involved in exopolysaccharide biosynthesis